MPNPLNINQLTNGGDYTNLLLNNLKEIAALEHQLENVEMERAIQIEKNRQLKEKLEEMRLKNKAAEHVTFAGQGQYDTLLLLLLAAIYSSAAELEMEDNYEMSENPPEPIDGRSFFFFGQIFRRWRDRWLAYHNAPPLYAGPAFPLNGYYNCPPYGCNPSAIAPQPGFYPQYVNGYYPTPLQQQQAAQGNSNVYIYQNDPTTATSSGTSYGVGYFGGSGTSLPQPSLPYPSPGGLPPILPPMGGPQAGSGSGSYGLGSTVGASPVGCIPPAPGASVACAMG
ncbi:uncharacterized protein Dwil_GK12084 [Drosophila willistoni]|uniref:Uncharacterized protein n=1 Tax=Drosophila willistoni TaxID=7260 RepID=B4N8L3_DROWI|nr:uncharacterized protein Dwil_GK12084 [Drosophila willistoni]